MNNNLCIDQQLGDSEKKYVNSFIWILLFAPIIWFVYGMIRKHYFFSFIFIFPILYYILSMESFLGPNLILKNTLRVLMALFSFYATGKARKLSWVKSNWISFDHFKASEKRYQIMAIIYWVSSFLSAFLPIDIIMTVEQALLLRI